MAEKTGMTAKIRKWVGLTAGICIQALAGSGACFSNYSALAKCVLGLSQVQLNNVGVAKDFGENVGLLSGFACDLLPPWALLLIGATEGLIGYGVLFLVLTKRIAPLAYWQVAVLLCLAANSSTWYNTAVLVTSMRNFPKSRGTVVGIIKGFIGLSGAIFTQIFITILSGNPSSFLLLLAFAPLTMIIFLMYFIQPVSSPTGPHDPEEEGAFFFVHIVCIGLAVYLFIVSVTENVLSLTPLTGKIIIAVMCTFLFSPLAVPAKFLVDKYFRGGRKRLSEHNDNCESLLAETERKIDMDIVETSERTSVKHAKHHVKEKSNSMCLYPSPELDAEEDPHTMLAVGEGAVRRKMNGPRRGEDFTLSQALVKADFWLLFLTFFCGVGTGATTINNLEQIGQAQGFSDVTVFVSLFSICNFLGRLGGGTVSEHWLRLWTMPRTAVMMVAQVLMIIGHLLFASAISGSLFAGSILLGTSSGMHYTIMVPTASELFGLRDFGMIYNFITIGSPVGSLLFSGIIAGYFYDKAAQKAVGGEGTECVGAHCFRITFLIMASVCLLGLLANVLLTLRIRPVYRSLYGAKITSSYNSSEQLFSATDKHSFRSSPRNMGSRPHSSSYQTLASSEQQQYFNSAGSEEGVH